MQEVEIILSLEHPNILKGIECFNDKSNFYVVMEHLAGGELFDQISKRGAYSEKDARPLMRSILDAMCYMHERDIVHRKFYYFV